MASRLSRESRREVIQLAYARGGQVRNAVFARSGDIHLFGQLSIGLEIRCAIKTLPTASNRSISAIASRINRVTRL